MMTHAPDFGVQVEAFLRDRPVNYFYRGRLKTQFSEGLGVPNDVARKGDLFFFPGCRPHSCDEKSVAVIKPAIGIVALAILHSDCGEPDHAEGCPQRNILSIFVDHPHAPDKVVIDGLTEWALAKLASEPDDRLIRVEILPARPGR